MTIRQFRKRVYDYYAGNRRRLPWRRTHDPYLVLVSEIMLQQTQVSRVTQKYVQFSRSFPTIESLAGASLPEVMACWQGLGYNRRALSLHRLAQEVVSGHGGVVPRQRGQLCRLPGIGDATAGAICAFAFNQPVVFIETNIRSVFLHFFFKGKAGVRDEQLLGVIEKALDRKNPRKWYSALMDYGVHLKATVDNPSRRSRHYVRQGPFEGSIRQARGAVIKNLLKHKKIEESALCRMSGLGPGRMRQALDALCAEGLVAKKGSYISIGN